MHFTKDVSELGTTWQFVETQYLKIKLGVTAHTLNPSAWEAGGGWSLEFKATMIIVSSRTSRSSRETLSQ